MTTNRTTTGRVGDSVNRDLRNGLPLRDLAAANELALQRAMAAALNSDFFQNSKAGQRALRALHDAPTQVPASEEDLSALYTPPGGVKAQRAAAFARIDNDPALKRALADAENSDYFRQGKLGARARRALSGEAGRSWDDPFRSHPSVTLPANLPARRSARNEASARAKGAEGFNKLKFRRIPAENLRGAPRDNPAGGNTPSGKPRRDRIVLEMFPEVGVGKGWDARVAQKLLLDLKALIATWVSDNPHVELEVNFANKAESTFASHLVPGPGGFVLGVALNTATDKGVKNDDVTTGAYWKDVAVYSAILKVIESMPKPPGGANAQRGPNSPEGRMPPQLVAVLLATRIYAAYKWMEKQDKIDEIAANKKNSPFGPEHDEATVGLPGHDPDFKHTLPAQEQKGDIYKGVKFQNWSNYGGAKARPKDPAVVDLADEVVFWVADGKNGKPSQGGDTPVDLPYGGNGSKEPKDNQDVWNGATIGLPKATDKSGGSNGGGDKNGSDALDLPSGREGDVDDGGDGEGWAPGEDSGDGEGGTLIGAPPIFIDDYDDGGGEDEESGAGQTDADAPVVGGGNGAEGPEIPDIEVNSLDPLTGDIKKVVYHGSVDGGEDVGDDDPDATNLPNPLKEDNQMAGAGRWGGVAPPIHRRGGIEFFDEQGTADSIAGWHVPTSKVHGGTTKSGDSGGGIGSVAYFSPALLFKMHKGGVPSEPHTGPDDTLIKPGNFAHPYHFHVDPTNTDPNPEGTDPW